MNYSLYFKTDNNRGIFYASQGELNKSISDLTLAIEINPHDAKAYYNRGLSKAQQGNFFPAIFDYSKAITIDPDYADAHYNRGLKQGPTRGF